MSDRNFDLEITLLQMEGKTAPEIANFLDVPIESVISCMKEGFEPEDSNEFLIEEFYMSGDL